MSCQKQEVLQKSNSSTTTTYLTPITSPHILKIQSILKSFPENTFIEAFEFPLSIDFTKLYRCGWKEKHKTEDGVEACDYIEKKLVIKNLNEFKKYQKEIYKLLYFEAPNGKNIVYGFPKWFRELGPCFLLGGPNSEVFFLFRENCNSLSTDTCKINRIIGESAL